MNVEQSEIPIVIGVEFRMLNVEVRKFIIHHSTFLKFFGANQFRSHHLSARFPFRYAPLQSLRFAAINFQENYF